MSNSEKAKTPPTLFFCWSGWRSKRIAECFKDYFDALFKKVKQHPRLEVEMSETLIEKGAPWRGRLLSGLKEDWAGIICVTPENRRSAWLHFEGGTLASQEHFGWPKRESRT